MGAQALQIRYNFTTKLVDLDQDNALPQLQKAVGGYIELVNLSDDMLMWVNEEGAIEKLPGNLVGTHLWDQSFPEYKGTNKIFGNVIITGVEDENGNLKDIDEDVAAEITKLCIEAKQLIGSGKLVY